MNRQYRAGDENREETTFVDCEAWGRTAEVMHQYLAKGRPVLVEGRLKLDQWQDRDGNNRSKLKVVVENFQFVDSRGGSGGGGNAPTASAPAHSRSRRMKSLPIEGTGTLPVARHPSLRVHEVRGLLNFHERTANTMAKHMELLLLNNIQHLIVGMMREEGAPATIFFLTVPKSHPTTHRLARNERNAALSELASSATPARNCWIACRRSP